MSANIPSSRLRTGLALNISLGLAGLGLLGGLFGGWAANTPIAGAVIAHGQVVVHGRPRPVQSLDGGIVAGIAAKDGDIVAAGQPLLRLDPTLLAINLDIARGRLAAALAQRARLEAEQRGDEAPRFAYPPLPFPKPDTAQEEAGQTEIFKARAAVLEGGRAQLAETLLQFDSQLDGVAGQIRAAEAQAALLDADIDNQRKLLAQGLSRQSQLNDLERRRAELDGELAALQATRARLAIARRDAELETLQTERGFMEQVVTELREVTTQVEELTLEIVTRSAQLDRIELRAPVAGIVHEMQVTSIGGVVAPGATVVEVVPLADGLDFELRVDPRAIDQIRPGQPAQLVLSAFDPRTTPRLVAEVASISADVIADPRGGPSFYRVGLTLPAGEIERLEGQVLVPGMPVEAYLQTGERSVLSYLVEPVAAHLRQAFRE